MDIKKYCETLKYLKKSQIRYLIKNRLTRGKAAVTEAKAPVRGELALWMPRLDEHPDYLKRFSLEELLDGNVTLLHESGTPSGNGWKHPDKSHLWNFNLQYLEFLIPLVAAYRETKKRNTTPVSVITVNDGSVTMRTEKEMAGIPTPFRCDLLICGSAWMDLKVGCRKIKYFF